MLNAVTSRFATLSYQERRDRYEQLRGSLWSTRSSFDSHWREIGDWELTRRTRFTTSDRNRGDKRNQNIINNTIRIAARTLSSGLHAGLTSPARPWFKLTTPDPELAKFKPVQEWLEQVTQRMYVILADSNIYNTLPTLYGDMGTFGTAAMSVLRDDEDLCRSVVYPPGSYAISLDKRGLATTFVLEYELDVLQIVQEFGVVPGRRDIDWSNISQTVKDLWDRGQYTESVKLLWIVTPNVGRRPGAFLAKDRMKWSSCHIEVGAPATQSKGLLRESGLDRFPILCPRWDVTFGDSYGTDCPGMTALGDTKQLQSQERDKGRALKKMVDPPLKGSPELMATKVSLLPGNMTYLRDTQHGLSPIHEVRVDLNHLAMDMDRVEYRIHEAFFSNLFLMLAQRDSSGARPNMTAREVDERHEEKLLALGPVLERTNDEALDPMVDLVYDYMDEAGLLPDPPPDINGVRLKVEYISILAQAQKLAGVAAQDRFVMAILPIAEAVPDIWAKVDTDRLVDIYGETLGLDPRVLRSEDDAKAIRAAQQQALAAQQEAETAATMAKAGQAAGATPLGTGSLLDRIVGGVANARQAGQPAGQLESVGGTV